MDVKYVPAACYVGTDGEKFYQYTMIEEASRERFIYAYKEASSYSTIDFVQRAIIYFGYAPDMIQTDNGGEFTHTQKTDRVHPLDAQSVKEGLFLFRQKQGYRRILRICEPKKRKIQSCSNSISPAFSNSW